MDLIDRQLASRGLTGVQSAEANADYLITAGMWEHAAGSVDQTTTSQWSGGRIPGPRGGETSFVDWVYTLRVSIVDSKAAGTSSQSPCVIEAESNWSPLQRTIPALIDAAFKTLMASPSSAGIAAARSIAVQYGSVIPVAVTGRTPFSSGNGVVIESVTGDRPHIQAGGSYLVEGTYTLGSDESAILLLTASMAERMSVPVFPEQRLNISRGTGHFSLSIQVPNVDSFKSLHISLYPVNSGGTTGRDPQGGLYFSEKT
jgi:hypothetical protein